MTAPLPPGHPQEAPAADSQAAKDLKELVGHLQQNPDAMTPDVTALVQKHKAQNKKQYTKGLHSAVTDLGKARESLDAALTSRSNLMSRWRTFLTASLKQWSEYTEMFQAQEKACKEQINVAREEVAQAKVDFERKKTTEPTEISDDDIEVIEQATREASNRILDGMQNMATSLQQLSEQAEKDQQEAEQRQSKRARKNDEEAEVPMTDDRGSALSGAKALQPFAAPGQ
eukprot:s894_g22.t1